MIAVMDCSSSSSGNNNCSGTSSNLVTNDEITSPRVKFLCSFGGSILPRPQDGKLRYVGGETRIVSVRREVGCEELMEKMRELYDGAAILKYQQPDEDLDALVSVVNDDDVTNMMEEYDKLGSGDGFTRLRIFLFSHPEQDMSPHFMDGDERDTERRYVDALNSLNESPDYRRHPMGDSPVLAPVDEVQIADQLFNSINLEESVHNLRNYEMGMPQYNLRQLAVPKLGSGQHSGYVAQQRFDEAPWSSAYYSPRCGGPHDARPFTENPSSPSARYRGVFQEGQDVNSQIPFDQQHLYADNVVWMPPGGVSVDRGGFPGNILNGPSNVDGLNACGHCKTTFQRNPSSSDFHWRPEEQSHLEQPTVGNGFSQISNTCHECLPRREAAMLNTDPKLLHGVYNREQSDPFPHYNETHFPDKGWMGQNQLWMDEQRAQISGVGRIGEHYSNGTGANTPLGQTNLPDGNLAPSNYARHEDPRYIRPGVDMRGAGSHLHIPLEERSAHISNLPNSYGVDMAQQVLHSNPSQQAMWGNVPSPMHVPPGYDSYNIQPRPNIPNTIGPRSNFEDNPGFFVGGDHSPWIESSHRISGNIQNLIPNAPFNDIQQTFTQDHLRNMPSMLNVPPPLETRRSSEIRAMVLNDSLLPSSGRGYTPVQRENTGTIEARFDEKSFHCEVSERTHLRDGERSDLYGVDSTVDKNIAENNSDVAAFGSNSIKPGDQVMNIIRPGVTDTNPLAENEGLSFLPELIASAKRAKMESVEMVKAIAHEDTSDPILQDEPTKLANVDETETEGVDGHSEGGSDDENVDVSKIERTKAEEEAIAKGLQVVFISF